MSGFRCIDISTIPSDREGFYATNNQFQKSGPKGFIEVKVLENNNLYVRVDLPGVPDDGIHHRVDAVRQKVVFFSGVTFNDGYEKQGVREYSGTAGLGCDCCEITGVDAKMKDGVLRMIVSRVKVKDHENKCTLTVPPFTGKSGRRVEDHPFVVRGRKGAFVGESTADGGLFFAVDMPGVSNGDDVEILANEFEVRFKAEIKNVGEHDESGRIYLGTVDASDSSSSPDLLKTHSITAVVNFGILKILLKPRVNTNTNKE
ncbi:unnamed protein product [Microthlaspi erraticum]|uniref:SHSP domain-containing protein n=1 Tax=Microthlaspi erraticum TaxID=1685480 RepID=A0A6D2JKP1_9BRAS|nr:unnamed protein product [Microthlaspi erraticum]